MSDLVKTMLNSLGIPADENEVAILADGYEYAHAVAVRLHGIPVGTTPPASLLNPAPQAGAAASPSGT